MSFYIAVDAGFTNTRVAVVKSGEVIAYATSATPGRCDKGVDGSNADALQERWLCHLVAQVKSQLSSEGACLGVGAEVELTQLPICGCPIRLLAKTLPLLNFGRLEVGQTCVNTWGNLALAPTG